MQGANVFLALRLQVVMDEADKLLGMDVDSQLDEIIGYTPRTRQIMLFSATFPFAVKAFKTKHIPQAYEINLMESLTLRVRAF